MPLSIENLAPFFLFNCLCTGWDLQIIECELDQFLDPVEVWRKAYFQPKKNIYFALLLLLQIDAPCTIVSGGHMDRTKEVICNLASPLNFVIEMFSYLQVFNPIAIT